MILAFGQPGLCNHMFYKFSLFTFSTSNVCDNVQSRVRNMCGKRFGVLLLTDARTKCHQWLALRHHLVVL
jgi:hypothetical protein